MARLSGVRVLAVGLAVVLLATLCAPAPAQAFDPISMITLAGLAIDGLVGLVSTVGFLAIANSRDSAKMPGSLNYGGTTLQCVGAEITPTNCRIIVTPKSESFTPKAESPDTPAAPAATAATAPQS
jgi:hypothetical protein